MYVFVYYPPYNEETIQITILNMNATQQKVDDTLVNICPTVH